jgi:integrase
LPEVKTVAITCDRWIPGFAMTQDFPGAGWATVIDDNFNKQWRHVRDGPGAADVATHSFRKSLATLIDDEGLSARIGADHLGPTNVSMTQDKYMSRGRVHTQVADLLERRVSEPDGQRNR